MDGERPSDRDTLTLTSAHLVRVAVHEVWLQPNLAQECGDLIHDLTSRCEAVKKQRFRNDLLDLLPGTQRGVGVLKYDLHPTTHVPHICSLESQQVFAVKVNRSPGGFNESQYRSAQRRFPTAGLTDQPQYFTASQYQIHAIDRTNPLRSPEPSIPERKISFQAGNEEEDVCGKHHWARGHGINPLAPCNTHISGQPKLHGAAEIHFCKSCLQCGTAGGRCSRRANSKTLAPHQGCRAAARSFLRQTQHSIM